jgi:hypothetical protein
MLRDNMKTSKRQRRAMHRPGRQHDYELTALLQDVERRACVLETRPPRRVPVVIDDSAACPF